MNIVTNMKQDSKVNVIKSAKSYIGKRGYSLNKSFFTSMELDKIKAELTVKPNVSGDYGSVEEPFKVFLESKEYLYIPKQYGIERFGPGEHNILPKGEDISVSFDLKLKDEQVGPAEKTMNAYLARGGGILSLPCGFGKTILGCYFISALKKKTLVIVHKEFLMNQWIERIQFALPGAKIGVVQGDRCEIEGKDVILGMLQTLSMKEFAGDAFNGIGHVIIDECHRIPSRVFSKALLKVNSKYMLGLSATPNRKDGLTKVLKWYIGDIIFSIKGSEKNVVKVERYLIDSKDEHYNNEVVNYMGKAQMPTMLNNIADCRLRTKLIMTRVIEELGLNEKRQFLVLSDRKQHLEDMYKFAIDMGLSSVGYYVGGMKKEKLKENESCRLLLGTYPMANEGLDIPSLNGLVLSTPKSDIIQSVGRICRVVHEGIQPLIIDVIDQFSIFEGQAKKRFVVYKKKGYEIIDIPYNIDKGISGIKKSYSHHLKKAGANVGKGDSCGDDSDDECDMKKEECVIDTEYNNIDPFTNKIKKSKVKSEVGTGNESSKKDMNINDMFKNMNMDMANVDKDMANKDITNKNISNTKPKSMFN
jgi:superfamily II DNA or RNA helicase